MYKFILIGVAMGRERENPKLFFITPKNIFLYKIKLHLILVLLFHKKIVFTLSFMKKIFYILFRFYLYLF